MTTQAPQRTGRGLPPRVRPPAHCPRARRCTSAATRVTSWTALPRSSAPRRTSGCQTTTHHASSAISGQFVNSQIARSFHGIQDRERSCLFTTHTPRCRCVNSAALCLSDQAAIFVVPRASRWPWYMVRCVCNLNLC